jgi:exopolysaccharide biosynthesis protein
MNKKKSLFCSCHCALIFFVLVFIFPAGLIFPQQQKEVGFPDVPPGIEYFHQRIGNSPLSIHMIKIDRSRTEFKFVSSLAKDTIYGLSPLSEQIRKLSAEGVVPLAAINGDFFKIRKGPYQGDPLGLQIIEGELVSSPNDLSFWIDSSGKPNIGKVRPAFHITGADGIDIPFSINQERTDSSAVLYTSSIGPSTRTKGGVDIILKNTEQNTWPPLQIGFQYTARVHHMRISGDTPLKPDVLVLSLGPKFGRAGQIKIGTRLSISLETIPSLRNVDVAIAGRPVLVQNGEPAKWEGKQPRHPRTALGWNKTHFFFVVVDGRQRGLSIGMTFPELASLMQGFGCTDALNLDGGGSSTIWLGGKVLNSPSDGRERSIANGLILIKNVTR